jgi:hypothetical protein
MPDIFGLSHVSMQDVGLVSTLARRNQARLWAFLLLVDPQFPPDLLVRNGFAPTKVFAGFFPATDLVGFSRPEFVFQIDLVRRLKTCDHLTRAPKDRSSW